METQPQESGETQQPENTEPAQDFVEMHEATDEELEAFLDEELAIESQEAGEQQETSGEEPDANKEAEPEEQAAEAPEGQEQAPAPAVDPAYVEKLKARLEQQERYIKHRSNEIGDLRKQLRDARGQVEKRLREDEHELSAVDAAKLTQELRETDRELERLEVEEVANDAVLKSQGIVKQHIRPEEWDMQAMALSLQSDGVAPEHIQGFVANPFNTDGLTLVHLSPNR
jgi:ribosomal protein L9